MKSLVDRFAEQYNRLPTETDPDYLEMLRMSKYRIIDVPDFTPHKCANCGASKNDGRKYIDFGNQIDWYGTMYLCGHCVHDIADNMGMFDSLRKELEEAANKGVEVEELLNKGEKLHEHVVKTYKEFEDFYAHVHSSDDSSSSDGSDSLGNEEAAPESNVNQPKPRATKSTTVSGSKDIRSLTDLLNNSAS